MIDLEIKADREKLEKIIREDIDEYCKELYESDHRDHLGASVMGDECLRKIYYGFRWVKKPDFSGRIRRLFQVGHDSEERFVKYLEGIGCKVWAVNPDTGKQFRITGCNGHYGGSLDAKIELPTRYQISEQVLFLGEFKTNGTGAGFTDVDKKEFIKAKPKHWAQKCQYGYKEKLKYGFYLIENKNDSDIIVKIILLDWNYGQELEKTAQDIINAKIPPPRISDNPAYFACRTCDLLDLCHGMAKVEINCRSCKFAEPIENGEWKCNRFDRTIPKDFIRKGCNYHLSVNE